MKRVSMLTQISDVAILTKQTHAFRYKPVRAICSVGWNLMELTVDKWWDVCICYIKYSCHLTNHVSKCWQTPCCTVSNSNLLHMFETRTSQCCVKRDETQQNSLHIQYPLSFLITWSCMTSIPQQTFPSLYAPQQSRVVCEEGAGRTTWSQAQFVPWSANDLRLERTVFKRLDSARHFWTTLCWDCA